VRTAPGLYSHDAVCGKSFRARENELVFFRIDVIGDDVDVVVIAKPLAECFYEGSLAGPDGPANSDTQRMVL
jgi:hypothetical protein